MQDLAKALPEGGLRGERVLLRRPSSSDRPAVLEACTDPDIRRFSRIPDPNEAADAEQWAVTAAAAFETGIAVHLVITDPYDTDLYGAIGLVDIDPQGRIELGTWVAPDFRRLGVAREAAEVLAGFVFEHRPEATLLAEIEPDNGISRELARSIGFRPLPERSDGGALKFELAVGDLRPT